MFLAVKLQLAHSTNGAYDPLPATIGLANAPLHCLFSDVYLLINNKEVSRLSDATTSAYIHQLLTQSGQKQANNDSSNPIALLRRWGATGGIDDQAGVIARRSKSLGVLVDTGIQTVSLAAKIPIFLGSNEVGQNQSFILRLVVNPNWRNRIVSTTLDTITRTGPIADIGAGAHTVVNMDVAEMVLNVREYETSTVPRDVVRSYPYTEFFSTTRAIGVSTGSQRFQITMPKSVSAVFFTLFDSRESGGGTELVHSPTDFVCDGIKFLTSYEIRYASTTLPSLRYKLDLRDATRNREDNNQAFKQFIQDSADLSPNGSQFSSQDWASAPVFYHQVMKIPGSQAETLTLELVFSQAPTNSILYFGAFEPRELSVAYNSVGIISSLDVFQTAE